MASEILICRRSEIAFLIFISLSLSGVNGFSEALCRSQISELHLLTCSTTTSPEFQCHACHHINVLHVNLCVFMWSASRSSQMSALPLLSDLNKKVTGDLTRHSVFVQMTTGYSQSVRLCGCRTLLTGSEEPWQWYFKVRWNTWPLYPAWMGHRCTWGFFLGQWCYGW